MPRPVQYPSSLMHWPMEQEDPSDATYATHVTGTFGSPVGASSSIFGSPTLSHLTLHEPSTISTVPLSYGVLPVGASVHDTLPINHSINHGILQASTNLDSTVPLSYGVLPVGASVHDTLPINHSINHGIQTALTGLDIDVSDSKHLLTGNQAALLEADMTQAATEWMDHIDNPNHTPINILINVTDDDKNHPRFDGSPAFVMSTGIGANATWESAVEYKLQNGADPTTGMESYPKLSDGAQADVVININSHYLDSTGWLDPNPAAGSDPVPPFKVDMVSELVHEFGHGLGIGSTKSLDTTTGTFGAGEKTSWESLLDIEKSGTYFTGSHAEQEHGGPVVVTTNTPEENYGHLGNVLSDATDPNTGGPDVMYGVSFDEGERYEVSDLDVAILQDLGYDTKGPVPKDINISEMAHPTPFDIHSLVSTLPGTIAIHAANHATNFSTLLGESAGLSHSFWGQAAAASSISSLLGSHATQGLGTGTTADQSSLVIPQAADQLSHLTSGAHSDISALTAAHVVAPTALADAHIAQLQLDIAHVSDFAHQLHI